MRWRLPVSVVAYLRAVDAHDSATAQRLMLSDRSNTTGWLANTASLRNIRVTGEHLVQQFNRTAGGPYTSAWVIDTSFDYEAHWWRSGSALSNGFHPYWGFDVVRDNGQWRVFDDGQG